MFRSSWPITTLSAKQKGTYKHIVVVHGNSYTIFHFWYYKMYTVKLTRLLLSHILLVNTIWKMIASSLLPKPQKNLITISPLLQCVCVAIVGTQCDSGFYDCDSHAAVACASLSTKKKRTYLLSNSVFSFSSGRNGYVCCTAANPESPFTATCRPEIKYCLS